MAGSTSKWTNLGSNTTDPSLNQNISVVSGSGINTQIRHECHVFLDDTNKIATDAFDWAIDTDFTVVLNGGFQELNGDPGNIDCDIEGSVDGTNYFKLKDLVTWDEGTQTIGAGVYSLEDNGKMPYMRLAMTPGSDVDNLNKPVKINLFMHTV